MVAFLLRKHQAPVFWTHLRGNVLTNDHAYIAVLLLEQQEKIQLTRYCNKSVIYTTIAIVFLVLHARQGTLA